MKVIIFLTLVCATLVLADIDDCIAHGELELGLTCVKQCPAGYSRDGNSCYFDPKPVTRNVEFSEKCPKQIPSMFFSWLSYQHTPFFLGKNMQGTPRLENCGAWTVVNEFHRQDFFAKLNQHVSIVVNEQQGVVLFAFRGTEMDFSRPQYILSAWANNFKLLRKTYPYQSGCGSLHTGFLNTFATTEAEVRLQLYKFLRAGYRVIFTGHSLGGGVANIAAMRYMGVYGGYAKKMEVVTFGAPAGLGNADFAECYRNIVGASATHYAAAYDSDTQDIVSTLSPKVLGYVRNAGVRKFIHCNPRYFGNPQKIPNTDIGGPSLVPKAIGCHYQQVYMDGLLKETISDTPMSDLEEFNAILDDME